MDLDVGTSHVWKGRLLQSTRDWPLSPPGALTPLCLDVWESPTYILACPLFAFQPPFSQSAFPYHLHPGTPISNIEG